MTLLRGRTEYGDSVEDEWVIVWLLRELTRKFEDLWVKVNDSDGEFLLIEAAGTLPEWLEPEVAENRVCLLLPKLNTPLMSIVDVDSSQQFGHCQAGEDQVG